MPNIASIIQSHNKQVISNKPDNTGSKCNCHRKENCPMDGKCLLRNLVYNANVRENQRDDGPNYHGVTENSFKDRLYKHRNSFKYESKANSTELSKYIWELKKHGNPEPTIKWSLVDTAIPDVNGSKKCNLCLTERYHIITSPLLLLNKRSELMSKCRHENKFYLTNYKDIPPDN